METRTLLRDFQSHNQSRSVYTVEKDLVLKAKKIRLVDFNVYSDSAFQLPSNMKFHPFAGVYSLIKKISLLNLQGQEIDSMSNCINNMSLRLIHMDNGSQSEINSVISMTRNGFYNPSETTILSNVSNADPLYQDLYIDCASMLNYLNARENIAEGFTLIIEWNPPSLWGVPNIQDTYFISPPTLALDEVLGMSPQQVDQRPVMFTNMVNDQLRLSTSDTYVTTRLNSYYNQFISNLYYLNNYTSDDYNGLGFSRDQQETFELTIDGKKLLPLKGVDTAARKLALLNDFTGESCILLGSNQKLNNGLGIELTDSYLNELNLDNIMSYGCIKLDRFIQNDMTITYSRPDLGTNPTIIVSLLAEVLKMYDPKSGQLSYVRQ